MVILNKKKPFWKLKSCPRCKGDLYNDGETESCLQCGYTKDFEQKFTYVKEWELCAPENAKNA